MGRFFAGKTLPRKETASKSCWKLSSKSVTAIPKTGQNLPTTAWKYKLFFYGVRILKQFKACFWVNLSSTTIDNNRRRWLDCPLSKGNCAPNPKFERPNGKVLKSKSVLTSWPQPRIGASSSLESSMKRFIRRFDSNQNKSKQMKINDVFDYFTSKAYSVAILSVNFHLYQLKVPKQLT